MALSIQEILNTTRNAPSQYQEEFLSMLRSIAKEMFHQWQQQQGLLRDSEARLGEGVTASLTGNPKEYRTNPPFIKDPALAVEKDQKLSDIEKDDHKNQPRIK
jgi:hypothetical protein